MRRRRLRNARQQIRNVILRNTVSKKSRNLTWRGEEGGKALKKCKTVAVKGCIERSNWGNASPQIRNVISRNMVTKNQEIWLGDMPPERWRNWRKGVRGPQWPSEFFKMFQNGRIGSPYMTESNFVELFNVEFFLTEKLTLKVEIPLFWGFVLPSDLPKSGGDPV